MKIAFAGKWWSGKTTLTSLFIQYLCQEKKKIIAIDADINVWLADSLWIQYDKEKYISQSESIQAIRNTLIWENKKILSPNHFVKTTPPWCGSYIIDWQKQDFFNRFCSYQDDVLKFFHVWTYTKHEIWISCYHTHLSILENIISHTCLCDNEYMIVDMVAWNDSFSNTLHSQFDAIYLIVEPTKESIDMAKWFMDLALHSKESSKIIFIWNKIEDEDDTNYLYKNWISVDFYFPYNKHFKKYRRDGIIIKDEDMEHIFTDILKYLHTEITIDKNKKLQDLHTIHKKYIQLDYIKEPLWDLSGQIDLDFKFSIC